MKSIMTLIKNHGFSPPEIIPCAQNTTYYFKNPTSHLKPLCWYRIKLQGDRNYKNCLLSFLELLEIFFLIFQNFP